jgi:hypothetical protein
MFEAVFLLWLIQELNSLLLKHSRLCMKLNTSKTVRGSLVSGYVTVPQTIAEEDNDWSVTNVSQRDLLDSPYLCSFWSALAWYLCCGNEMLLLSASGSIWTLLHIYLAFENMLHRQYCKACSGKLKVRGHLLDTNINGKIILNGSQKQDVKAWAGLA